jgi:Lon protease-like protein
MGELDSVTETLGRLKVFPLPQGVLLPGCGLPLHVFEPRYRAMVAEALQGDRVLAVAMLAPGWEDDYQGRPRLLPIAGVGLIEEARRLDDGRYDILVRGIARVRIDAEHRPEKPFREVVARLASEPTTHDVQQLELLRRAVLQVSQALPKGLAQALATAAARIDEPGVLCDVVAAALLEDATQLQAVLEAVDVEKRVQRVLGEVGALLLAARPPPPGTMLS